MTFIVRATGSCFLYDTKKGPASARLMFNDEIKEEYGVSGLNKAWDDLATTHKALRMASTKRALSAFMVDRVVLSGIFPYSSAAQLAYTDISLYDVLSIIHKSGDLVRILEFETDSAFLMASTVRNILRCVLPAIAEDVLEQEAEYYAKINKDNYILPGDYEEVLSNMESTSKNDILDANKIVAGKITMEDATSIEEHNAKNPWISIRNTLKTEYEKNRDKINSACEEFGHTPDPVNHPQHYKSSSGLEAIDCIEAFTEELPGDIGYCVGNTIKYLCRFNKKGKPVEDLEKAKWYLNRAIENVKKKEE